MNLADAQALALLHMEAHGLLQQGWVFKFDVRTRRFGQCRVVKRRFDSPVLSRTLSLSAHLTRLNAEKEVEDTILHEVAHALAGLDADHGPAWKACASRLGARPEACYRPEEHGVKVPYTGGHQLWPPRFRCHDGGGEGTGTPTATLRIVGVG